MGKSDEFMTMTTLVRGSFQLQRVIDCKGWKKATCEHAQLKNKILQMENESFRSPLKIMLNQLLLWLLKLCFVSVVVNKDKADHFALGNKSFHSMINYATNL